MRVDNRLIQYGEILKNNVIKDNLPHEGGKTPNNAFGDILRQKISQGPVVFSKHAEQRLQERNIELSHYELDKLNAATQRAGLKGINNTLILMRDRAFIVNVPSSTVITAMDEDDMKENIFTQIDGAVIV